MYNQETKQNFWDACHRDDVKLYLAGTTLDESLDDFNIKTINPDAACLVIGVGLGYEVQSLAEFTEHVDVVDISQIALDRVSAITEDQYLCDELHMLPHYNYDYIFSYLVTQHLCDKELSKQLYHCIKSLAPNGVFCMQFAFIVDGDTPEHVSIDNQCKGLALRGLPHLSRLVDESGGFIAWASPVKKFEHTNIKHQFIHIKRL